MKSEGHLLQCFLLLRESYQELNLFVTFGLLSRVCACMRGLYQFKVRLGHLVKQNDAKAAVP